MRYREILQTDYDIFHTLATAYYREGEDAETPREELNSFITFLFGKLTHGQIRGCFVLEEELGKAGMKQCYVCAYGPAQGFWQHLGYVPNGCLAANGLPILTKHI